MAIHLPIPPTRPEQRRYGRVLDAVTKAGFVFLVAGFVAYVAGWIPSHVPVDQLASLWSLPLSDYLRATSTPTGWGWIAHLPKGEFASLAGIAILAGCSAVCLAAIVPVYVRQRDWFYAAICVAEIAVLALAASGALTPGH
jgi:hypothetical protein